MRRKKGKGKEKGEGRIISVKQNGIVVLVPRFGIEGKVYLCDGLDTSQFWTLDKNTQSVTSPDKSIQLQVFGKVTVEISMDETKQHSPKVVFKCLNPPIHQSSGTPYTRVVKDKKPAAQAKQEQTTSQVKSDSQVSAPQKKEGTPVQKRKRAKSVSKPQDTKKPKK
eukprot:TRINITY_DN5788_c0_g1_i1.p1 TRINITY_DN5788_c0_g1~~TRINITY_DN5788_c0_g1_i1.p1  ORF type:complete len:166 (+),score=48.38 TRINITY_DN5788_c0_g1_i1:83-580(+)